MLEKLQANMPLTDSQGNLTPYALEVFEKWVREFAALEARVTALEP